MMQMVLLSELETKRPKDMRLSMNEQDIMIEVNHMSHIYIDENGNDVRALMM